MNLVPIRPHIPDAVIDLRYQTGDNIFDGKKFYPEDFEPLLDERAARDLAFAAKLFQAVDLKMLIWDVWRPRDVQVELIGYNDDPRYVLSPDDSNHPKGLAVDMTLLDLHGNALDMGTDFDDFTDAAHLNTTAEHVSARAHSNRRHAAKVMKMAGFHQLPTEWWHFDWVGRAEE